MHDIFLALCFLVGLLGAMFLWPIIFILMIKGFFWFVDKVGL